MLSWASDDSKKIHYSPLQSMFCEHSKSALELEQNKTVIPATAGVMSGEGSNIGTILTRSGGLAGMELLCIAHQPRRLTKKERKKDTACIPWTYNLTQQQTRTGT